MCVCFPYAKVASVGGIARIGAPQFTGLVLISRLCRHVFSTFDIFI